MWILGISAFYHDSAAALIRDGEIVAAAQEERFTRQEARFGFPATQSVTAWTRQAYYDGTRFGRLLRKAVFQVRTAAGNLSGFRAARVAIVPDGVALWIREKLFQKDLAAAS